MSDDHAPNARRAATWRRYLRFWGPRAAADVDDELRFHIEMRVHDYAVCPKRTRAPRPCDASATSRRIAPSA